MIRNSQNSSWRCHGDAGDPWETRLGWRPRAGWLETLEIRGPASIDAIDLKIQCLPAPCHSKVSLEIKVVAYVMLRRLSNFFRDFVTLFAFFYKKQCFY